MNDTREKLQSRVRQLGAIGGTEDGGVTRALYTADWQRARDQVQAWMEEDGLTTRIDAAGNLFGRLGPAEGPCYLTGSHIDTVRNGGLYDGALGVLSALDAVAELGRRHGAPKTPLEVVVTCEEEGSRYHLRCWGSRAMLGMLEPGEWDHHRDPDGVVLSDAMRSVGLDPAALDSARRSDIKGFLELHIEQGRVLETDGTDVGIVTGICGMKQLHCTVRGRADHAGTTPMDLREDALACAASMIVQLRQVAADMGRPAVATVGRVGAEPDQINVVPAKAWFTVDIRHAEADRLQTLVSAVQQVCRKTAEQYGLEMDIESLIETAPSAMDAGLVKRLEEAADRSGLTFSRLPSGAGHDAMIFASKVPAAMIFVPCRDGRSHSPMEYSSPEQIAAGTQLLRECLYDLAYGGS